LIAPRRLENGKNHPHPNRIDEKPVAASSEAWGWSRIPEVGSTHTSEGRGNFERLGGEKTHERERKQWNFVGEFDTISIWKVLEVLLSSKNGQFRITPFHLDSYPAALRIRKDGMRSAGGI